MSFFQKGGDTRVMGGLGLGSFFVFRPKSSARLLILALIFCYLEQAPSFSILQLLLQYLSNEVDPLPALWVAAEWFIVLPYH